MADPGAPPPPRAGLSLYADLLGSSNSNPSSNGTISRAPVLFGQNSSTDATQEQSTAKKQPNAAALRFQPTKRPQLAAQKTKPKASFATALASQTDPAVSDTTRKQNTAPAAPPAKSTLADWTGDDDGFFADQKHQRGGRRKRKKEKEDKAVVQDWDDIYDPSRPNVYDDFKNSEEKYREVREWKDRLYAHRFAKERRSSGSSSGSDRYRPSMNRFAPPSEYSFAPPKIQDAAEGVEEEDPYTRRMRLSQSLNTTNQAAHDQATPPSVSNILPAPPPPPLEASESLPPPPPPPPSTPAGGLHIPSSTSIPPNAPPANIISRAAVRYQLPSAPAELPSSEAELADALRHEAENAPAEGAEGEGSKADPSAPRSLRPGQQGFAARLMSKYGWTKGSGLGADGSGIVNPLRVQMEKRKKRGDAEGGGFVGPAGKGKIIGSRRNVGPAEEQQEGRFGPMSEVVVLRGMVDGMDVGAEMGEGGLMQEIGDECSEKYGRVERVFIDRDAVGSVPVFVKFTSQLSALRAVNALEGRIFSGNPIQAKFFDADKFESGVYQ